MCERPHVLHLVDDTTAGGVMRVLEYITTSAEMAKFAEHTSQSVPRGAVHFSRYDADILVSHMVISWRTLPALLALRLANLDKRFVHVEHSYTEGFVRHNVARVGRFHSLLRLGFSFFDQVVAVSQGQSEWLLRRKLCPQKKLKTIRSCVDLSGFAKIKPPRAKPKVIGAIGRLDRQKGFDKLIAAFRTLDRPDVELRIYGTGEEEGALRELAHNDPRISFIGHVADPNTVYADVDVVVMPSRWEAYGLVALEALCAGRPVICSNVDGLADHCDFGGTAMPGETIDDVTAQLAQALAAKLPSIGHTVAAKAQSDFVSGWRGLVRSQPPSEFGLRKPSMAR